jgi:twinkle protein
MDYRDYNIDIRTNKTSGEVQTTCPNCSHTRKKKTDKCLSVNLDKQTWFCHHCAWKGTLVERAVEYVKPEWKNKTDLSEPVVKWFEERGINQNTLKAVQISEGLEWMPQTQKNENTIQFNYFRNGELINVKYRDGRKNFKLHKDSELIFYNIDCLIEAKDVVITEGEIDCLTFIESGIKNVVSVPNGANLNSNNMAYVDNCINLFDDIETIYIAADNDIAGRKLRAELYERFGIDRCKYLEFDEFKDANELLKHKGTGAIRDCVKNALEFPLEGVFTISDIDHEINDMYINGLDNGVNIGVEGFDELLRFAKGYITTITGIPGHGKSDFLDQIALKLNLMHGWKFGFYSPENKPTRLHVSKLARKLIGKKWFGNNNITVPELAEVKRVLNNNFWFIKPEKDFTLESILKHVKQLKKTKGIDAFVIDAWNKLEHKYGQSETKYIGESLDKIAEFCEINNVHCFLVAHPTKILKNKNTGLYEVPNLYNIAGSANFYNKTDNGISVYRNFQEDKTEVYVQKVKFSHWGKIGCAELMYHLDSGRFVTDYISDLYNWIDYHERKLPKEIEPLPNIQPSDAFGEVYNNNDEILF